MGGCPEMGGPSFYERGAIPVPRVETNGEIPMSERVDVYSGVTQQIITAVEANPGDWTMPWHSSAAADLPMNAETGRRYRGVNTVSLWAQAFNRGYTSPLWGTYKQWAKLGGQVRKGEKASLVVFYKDYEASPKDTPDAPPVRRMFARASYAFNLAQVDDYTPPAPPPKTEIETHGEAERIVTGTGAKIMEGGSALAYYVPSQDYIQLPDRGDFIGTKTSTPQEAWYSTVFHELTHWTGAKDRLDRNLEVRFKTEAYAAEELVAELGAAFLCARTGISQSPRMDHAQYIANWLKLLKHDAKAIFTAASQAEKAVAFITGEQRT